MALMPQISKENETSNYKSNIHEGKNKPCKAQRFMFISNTKSDHGECGCVLFCLYLFSTHGFHVHVQGACTCVFVCVDAAEQPWWLFLRCLVFCGRRGSLLAWNSVLMLGWLAIQ